MGKGRRGWEEVGRGRMRKGDRRGKKGMVKRRGGEEKTEKGRKERSGGGRWRRIQSHQMR